MRTNHHGAMCAVQLLSDFAPAQTGVVPSALWGRKRGSSVAFVGKRYSHMSLEILCKSINSILWNL
jgi:hypothetical protein